MRRASLKSRYNIILQASKDEKLMSHPYKYDQIHGMLDEHTRLLAIPFELDDDTYIFDTTLNERYLLD